MKKKPLGLKYSTMNNHYVKGQRVPSQKYKDNYDQIRWHNETGEHKEPKSEYGKGA